jgi:glycine betaine/choline ABC-type transport system substrate-binding protein
VGRHGYKDSWPPCRDYVDCVDPVTAVIAQLAGAISTEEMRKLNYEVDGARRDPKVVVREWLIKKKFIQ